MIKYFDSHAHYNDAAFDSDRFELIEKLLSDGVAGFVNAGTDLETSEESLRIAGKYDGAYAACGIYPGETGRYAELCTTRADELKILDRLAELLSRPKCVALGEIGLDFHYDDVPRDIQAHWFGLQLELARSLKIPVEVHDREAHGACLDEIRKYPGVTGMFHSYSGSAETASELIRLGWYISFSGSLTFKNAEKLRSVPDTLPRDRILIETDCPYLTPVPMRGKRNDSSKLEYTSETLAALLGLSNEGTAALTRRNAGVFFGIKSSEDISNDDNL